jgi:ribosomal protein S18 acetylase RimI-like enzyme
MTDHPRGTDNPHGASKNTERWDAKILHDAVREAKRTSPDSFLTTAEDVNTKSLDHWIDEMSSSTWAVAEREGSVVGVAAAKRPDPEKDREDQTAARYIESVWIAPDLRGHGLGHRLIKYLLEAECRKNRHVRQFLLWVFTNNFAAIRLYEHMGFVETRERNEGARTEIKYCLDLGSVVHSAVRSAVEEAARRQDKRQYGVTYRILGGLDSA